VGGEELYAESTDAGDIASSTRVFLSSMGAVSSVIEGICCGAIA